MDIKLLPRTNISYDQIWNYYKGDTGISDFAQPFPGQSDSECGSGGFLKRRSQSTLRRNVSCFRFCESDVQRVFQRLLGPRAHAHEYADRTTQLCSRITGRIGTSRRGSVTRAETPTYSATTRPCSAANRARICATRSIRGRYLGRRVAAVADFGATWHITDKLSFNDTFHYSNWHNPAEFDRFELFVLQSQPEHQREFLYAHGPGSAYLRPAGRRSWPER